MPAIPITDRKGWKELHRQPNQEPYLTAESSVVAEFRGGVRPSSEDAAAGACSKAPNPVETKAMSSKIDRLVNLTPTDDIVEFRAVYYEPEDHTGNKCGRRAGRPGGRGVGLSDTWRTGNHRQVWDKNCPSSWTLINAPKAQKNIGKPIVQHSKEQENVGASSPNQERTGLRRSWKKGGGF